ncbi:cyclic nucleotide-binding domain-containing protein [Nitrospinae bacterium]|jgi:CRP-like cAMP-binding protein|nr:cyclic nucleotide-binding domain-containing protein [Nitrospinota bacterium]
MKKQNYKKYEFIFNEGTYGDSAYMIDFGKVGIISLTNQNDKRKLIATLKKDDIFGEMGLIDNKVRTATAIALEETQVSVISKKTFDYLLKHDPLALRPLIKVLSHRLRNTTNLLQEYSRMPLLNANH